METKVMKRFFGLADFLEEQRFLEEQHKQGWKFIKFEAPRKYTFEKCEHEDYIYRLDYNEEEKDEEAYLQIFQDCGWEYLMKYQTWYYFRKKKLSLNESDQEIFSDNDSKIDMIKKVMWKQMLVLIPFVLFLPIFITAINHFLNEDIVFKMIWIVYILIMVFLLSMCVHNIIKLNKLIQSLANPLDDHENK
ncbi:DUF2812 domain-containing protein [Candidatus Stoquefichus massiliensis]|uniref:DUF2812 domain-containing protein n=1 Tax=Candidatus Stoquefichus massiliensis TaxID=1470350 RepID=UPI000485D799|nr:DUF2812 domain-containing protein [Candidatus Stoquefichus massiliensis]